MPFQSLLPCIHSHVDHLTISDRLADPSAVISSTFASEHNEHSQYDSAPSADTNLSTPDCPHQIRPQDIHIPQISAHHTTTLPDHSASSSARIVDQQDHHQLTDTTPSVATTVSLPISIPPDTTSVARRDPNRIPTPCPPVSARGDQRGHLFPFARTPSPHDNTSTCSKKKNTSSPESDEFVPGCGSGRRKSSSSSTRSHYIFSMQMESRYTPTSPLSPKLTGSQRPLSPQPAKRTVHSRQTSRNLHMTLPRFHPSNYGYGTAATPSSAVQSPAITLNRVNQPVQLESPRMMREKHREFLDSVMLSSKTAASPFGQKPGSPRLDPLGSPKGPVTPLALEEAGDYFAVTGTGKRSPAASPGGRSARSDGSSGKDDSMKNKLKVDIYQ